MWKSDIILSIFVSCIRSSYYLLELRRLQIKNQIPGTSSHFMTDFAYYSLALINFSLKGVPLDFLVLTWISSLAPSLGLKTLLGKPGGGHNDRNIFFILFCTVEFSSRLNILAGLYITPSKSFVGEGELAKEIFLLHQHDGILSQT